ncbi:galectin-8-like [Misgurnus anguillicaudatus]|uniref:galectin-8-like n=1 Tax=Misgurnus anguillicaudatus TaxID=75329 RepID=UPI003CCFD991
MNSFRNGGWEDEESGPDNPFNVGQAFEMFIVIKSEGYQVHALSPKLKSKLLKRQLRAFLHTDLLASIHQVYVNGKEHYLFKHRIPLEKVSVINIEGHVAVNLFAFIQNWDKSSFAKHLNVFLQSASSNIISELSLPVKNPSLPYVGPISGGLRPGMAMYLQGVVGSETDPFAINLKTGQSDKDDIAFHFHFQNNVKAVMNSFRGEKWEAEEFAPVPPFKMGEPLELIIVIKTEGYQVSVNGYEIYLFRHRIPVEKVSALNIVGNVAVNLCGFIQNWSQSSFAVKGMQILDVGSLQCELPSIQSDLLLPVQNPISYIQYRLKRLVLSRG